MKNLSRIFKVSVVMLTCFFLSASHKKPEKDLFPAELKAVENFQRIDKLIVKVDSLIYEAENK